MAFLCVLNQNGFSPDTRRVKHVGVPCGSPSPLTTSSLWMLSNLFIVAIDKGVDSVPYRIPGTAYFSHKLIRKNHGLGLDLALAIVAPIILSAFSVTLCSNEVKNTPLAISTFTPIIIRETLETVNFFKRLKTNRDGEKVREKEKKEIKKTDVYVNKFNFNRCIFIDFISFLPTAQRLIVMGKKRKQ